MIGRGRGRGRDQHSDRGQRGEQRGGTHGGSDRARGVCYIFQNTGTCRNGDNCRFSHNVSARETGGGNRARNVCFDFQNTGTCNRGDSCLYSHDNTNTTNNTAPSRVNEDADQRQARQTYNAWKRLLGSAPHDSRTMQRLWESAVDILQNGDRDRKQQLPHDLDIEDQNYNGRRHIQALMSKRVKEDEYTSFVTICQSFLLTMAHSSLLDCLAVDTYVSSIYNYISGANGARAIPFLQHLCEILISVRTDNTPSISANVLESTLVALSTVLRELMKREFRARFNNDVPILMESLETAASIFSPDIQSVSSTICTSRVREVRAIVARAKGLVSEDNPALPSTSTTSFYPRDLVIPCDRHDNDKLNIEDIVIFPTRDEILSDATEFLPFTDPNQPHFLSDPVQRHIDAYFRLLRHEVFGNLKTALAHLMCTLSRDNSAISNANLKLGDVRANLYTDASISQVGFGRNLEIQIAFAPPPSIHKKSDAEKRRWWEDSKRLHNDTLLSYIWIQGGVIQHLFLSIVRRDAKGKDEHDFGKYEQLVTVSAKLMTQDKATFEILMQAAANRSRGILIEFPKIMPATFGPVLENLQSMQRLGSLPFQQYIVPARHNELPGVRVYQDIPPPLYARCPGFKFSLKSISHNDDSFSVDPTASCDDEALLNEMESKTSLDRGQCRALVAALTREFAFIQGPPGTGKSYLGLQLMRVLLDVNKNAKLGPVLVV
jgi:hypothetical protein